MDPKSLTRFSRLLKAWRHQARRSQADVDEALGRPRGFIAQVEMGRLAPPRRKECFLIGLALGVPGETVWDASRPERLRLLDPELYEHYEKTMNPPADPSTVERSVLLERSILLARLALRFARVERITRHEDGVRPETDTDHSFMLSLIACELAPVHLDRPMLATFAAVHDFPEVVAGDVQTLSISSEQREDKERREAAARAWLSSELGPDSWLCAMIARYEAQVEPEARFIRLLDKVMPKLTHAMNACAAATPLVTYDGFVEAHHKQHADLAQKYPEFPETLALLRESMDHSEACWPHEAS
jgi:5'-deoxynucleotidase YfbR-like HD superfamily hydrolase